jgi:hypothetical protein
MTSHGAIAAAAAVFVVAALLYYQSRPMEGFASIQPPVAGRPYGAYDNADETYPVPADLNQAPRTTVAQTQVPTAAQRPAATPGAGQAPREAMATRKDLNELDVAITTWLDGAAQREKERPGSLTPFQLQRRTMLQGRLADVRTQMTTGLLTDSYRVVAQETTDLRRENAGWRQAAPNLEQIHEFGRGEDPEAFLSAELYAEFRRIFDAGLLELNSLTQPDPLQRVRLQQLQLLHLDLQAAERQFQPPPIRVASAQLFLRQMLKPDQPLPTLFAMEPNPATVKKTHTESPADVISALRDINWSLSVSHDPAGDDLKRSIANALDRLRNNPTPADVAAARSSVAAFQYRRSPGPAGLTEGGYPVTSVTGAPLPPKMRVASRDPMLEYDPRDVLVRANQLCHQIHEAFPHDAEALGCPPKRQPIRDTYDAESAINVVCDRLRTSVPSVSPEQFNCPRAPM